MNEPTFNPILMPVSTTRTLSPYYDEEISLIHRSVKQFNFQIIAYFFLIFDSLNRKKSNGIR